MTSRGSQVRSLSRPPPTLCSCTEYETLAIAPHSQRHVCQIDWLARSLFLQSRRMSPFRRPVSAAENSVPDSTFGDLVRSLFSLPSLYPKIPFPAAGCRRCRSATGNFLSLGGQKRVVSRPARSYRGFNPSASNCWLHSAGASRNRSTPMPRGSRPSTAARTRSGARNASDIVMLT